MANVNPYLHFNGNCEEAFEFYRSVFGGEFMGGISRYKDGPPGHVAESEGNKVMHVSLPIGKGSFIMGSDRPAAYGAPAASDNFFIYMTPDSEADANKIFNALSQNGQVFMAMEKTFWGAYFGMLKDKFGIQWMISYGTNNTAND